MTIRRCDRYSISKGSSSGSPVRVSGYALLEAAVDRFNYLDPFMAEMAQ